jgi:hypothetical protein
VIMESKQSQVARILNSTSNAFFTGLDKEDQSSLCGVLEEYFYENDAEGM